MIISHRCVTYYGADIIKSNCAFNLFLHQYDARDLYRSAALRSYTADDETTETINVMTVTVTGYRS